LYNVFFIGNEGLSRAFGMEHVSVYATVCFFAFLYLPLQELIGIAGNVISRKHEFEADRFAARTCGGGADLAAALKKLSVDNLANLTPHRPWFFSNTAIRRFAADTTIAVISGAVHVCLLSTHISLSLSAQK